MSCLTDPLQHFLERIMSDALEEHYGKVSIVQSSLFHNFARSLGTTDDFITIPFHSCPI